MKYESVQLRQMLAAEYALGTLRGAARRRFERLLAQDRWLRGELRHWEARLAELGLKLPAQAPRELVWTELQRRLNATPVIRPLQLPAAPAPNLRLLRAWAWLATAASLVLAVALILQMSQPPEQLPPQIVRVEVPVPAPPQVVYVALLQPQASAARWTISVVPGKKLMKVAAAATDYPLDAAHSLELWLIGPSGVPVAVGLLPLDGRHEMPLPMEVPEGAELTLAVSLEPQGGSPTGAPTGPVILTAPAISL